MIPLKINDLEIEKESKKIYSELKKEKHPFPAINVIGGRGLYVIWQGEKPIYVGESRDVKKRLKDMQNTLNHTLRRKIGEELSGEKATSKKKFSQNTEKKLNNHFRKNLKYSYKQINFGRVEIQDELVKHLTKKGYKLYNSEVKRGL